MGARKREKRKRMHHCTAHFAHEKSFSKTAQILFFPCQTTRNTVKFVWEFFFCSRKKPRLSLKLTHLLLTDVQALDCIFYFRCLSAMLNAVRGPMPASTGQTAASSTTSRGTQSLVPCHCWRSASSYGRGMMTSWLQWRRKRKR